MLNALPNTTQIPNMILDQLMPRLKDVELRVVLVIARQTLGWIEDFQTGRRKERDWISRSQLIAKTGRSARGISSAVDMLCTEGVIVAYNPAGEVLSLPMQRKMNFGKIFYRFNHKYGEDMLLGSLKEKKRRVQNLRTQKLPTTKLTHLTKDNNNKYIKKSQRQENLKQLQTIKQSFLQK